MQVLLNIMDWLSESFLPIPSMAEASSLCLSMDFQNSFPMATDAFGYSGHLYGITDRFSFGMIRVISPVYALWMRPVEATSSSVSGHFRVSTAGRVSGSIYLMADAS